MIRSRMSPSDVNASYGNTYLLVRPKGSNDDFLPAHIRDVGDEDGQPMLYLDIYTKDGIKNSRSQRMYDDLEIEYSWPKLGMSNLRGTAVYRSRVAERQWKRGVRERAIRNYFMSSTVMDQLKSGWLNPYTDFNFASEENIQSLFFPEYTPLDKALGQINDTNRIACALSQEFAVGLHIETDSPVIYCGESIVGVVVGDRVSFFDSSAHVEKLFNKNVIGA